MVSRAGQSKPSYWQACSEGYECVWLGVCRGCRCIYRMICTSRSRHGTCQPRNFSRKRSVPRCVARTCKPRPTPTWRTWSPRSVSPRRRSNLTPRPSHGGLPPAAQPGHPARFPACGLGREVCPARPGRRERPELREGPGLPGQFAAFRRRGQRGEYLVDRLPPGGVTVWQHAPAPRGPVQQRVNGPLPAGTVRPAAPLAFGHTAFETTRRPDALHGCDSRVPRPRWLTARIRGSRRPPPGSRPAAVNRGARPPGPPRDCGPPAGPRPGCPARRPPGAG